MTVDSQLSFMAYAFATSDLAAPPADAAAFMRLFYCQRRAGRAGGFGTATVRPLSTRQPVTTFSNIVLDSRYPGTGLRTAGCNVGILSFTLCDVYALVEDGNMHGNMTYKYGDEDLDPVLLPGSRILRRRVRALDHLAPRADIEHFTVVPVFQAAASVVADTSALLTCDWTAARARGLSLSAVNIRDDFAAGGLYNPADLSSFSPGYQTWQIGAFACLEPEGAAPMFADNAAGRAGAWAAVQAQAAAFPSAAPLYSGCNLAANGTTVIIGSNNLTFAIFNRWDPALASFRPVSNYARYRPYAVLRDRPNTGQSHSNLRVQALDPVRMDDDRAPVAGAVTATWSETAGAYRIALSMSNIFDHTAISARVLLSDTSDADGFAAPGFADAAGLSNYFATNAAARTAGLATCLVSGADAYLATESDAGLLEDEPQHRYAFALGLAEARSASTGASIALRSGGAYTAHALLTDAFGNSAAVTFPALDVGLSVTDFTVALSQLYRGVQLTYSRSVYLAGATANVFFVLSPAPLFVTGVRAAQAAAAADTIVARDGVGSLTGLAAAGGALTIAEGVLYARRYWTGAAFAVLNSTVTTMYGHLLVTDPSSAGVYKLRVSAALDARGAERSLVFKQTAPYFWSAGQSWSLNASAPTDGNYSILDTVETY
jgi:hypothetical protein